MPALGFARFRSSGPRSQARKEEQVKSWRFVTLSIVLVGIVALVLAEFTSWLPPAVRDGLVAIAPPLAAALALVLYFNWRARFRNQISATQATTTWRGPRDARA
jgi:O-antigen/teichoic acid export membrane protein